MTIAEGIAAAKLALDAGTKAIDLLRYPKIDGEAVRTKITEMQDLVFSTQRALGEAEEENRHLRRQLDEREQMKAVEADLEMEPDGQYRYRASERAANKHIPYCPVCWGEHQKLIPLTPFGEGQAFQCGIHKTKYYTKVYLEAVKRANQAGPRVVRSSWFDRHY
jgi:hypothetical protein